MELFAVGALEHLERHAEVHDLAGFQAHVVAVAHLRVGAVQEEGAVLLVERDQDEDPFLLQSGALDADAAVGFHVHVEVGGYHVLAAFHRGELERPVARIRVGQDDVAVVGLVVGAVARFRMQYGAVLRGVADRLLACRRGPGHSGRSHERAVALGEQEQRVVLDQAHVACGVAAGHVPVVGRALRGDGGFFVVVRHSSAPFRSSRVAARCLWLCFS